jgi:ParB-like chromosome segregation protein Spo0J
LYPCIVEETTYNVFAVKRKWRYNKMQTIMKHEVKYIDPLELKPYENNPRVNDYAVKKVLASIEEFGFTSPILVDKDLVIIAGHTRREAAILKGLNEVPYIVVDWMSPEQVRAYRIADNKLSELSIWDEDLLREELFALEVADFSLEVMGFTEMDLKDLFEEKDDEAAAEKAPKEKKTTLPMLRFGSNSIRITEDELVILSNRYNEYVEAGTEEGFVVWLLKRGL